MGVGLRCVVGCGGRGGLCVYCGLAELARMGWAVGGGEWCLLWIRPFLRRPIGFSDAPIREVKDVIASNRHGANEKNAR